MSKFVNNRKVRITFTVALTIIMFGTLMIINYLTPPIADDYTYTKGLIFGTTIPVRSLSDAFQSAANMYMTQSGRVFTDCFGHLILSMFGRPAIAFINSALYMLTVWLLYQLIRGNGKHSICLFLGINLSLWVFVPELGQDIFWFSGVANYLMPMPPILFMLLIYRRNSDSRSQNDSGIKCVLMTLLGVISGWQLENSSLAVPVVTLAYICLWKYKGTKVPKWAWLGFAGSVLGYILLVAAPGTSKRYEYETQIVSLSIPFKLALITYYWIMFVGVLTALFAVGVIKCGREKSDAVLYGGIFALGALATAYCMILAHSSPERTWFITVSLMTVAVGIVLKEAFSSKKVSGKLRIVFCVTALAILGTMAADTILASYDIHQQFIQREEIIATAKENGETVVSVPVYELKYPLKANRYALYGLYDIELGENSLYSFNETAAKYYGVDAIIGISGE